VLNISDTSIYEYIFGDGFNFHLQKHASNLPSESPKLKGDQDRWIVKHQ